MLLRVLLSTWAAAGLFLGVFPAGTARAVSVLPLDLPQLTDQAERIFVGRCEGTEASLDERGWPATYVTFRVTEGLKGTADGEAVLIKQFGASRKALKVAEGEKAVVSPKTAALAGRDYKAGAEYLLFLYPESDLGFTSPVGGGQGRFEILSGPPRPGATAAASLAVNPLNNRFLKTFREGPVPLDDLVKEIRKRVMRAER